MRFCLFYRLPANLFEKSDFCAETMEKGTSKDVNILPKSNFSECVEKKQNIFPCIHQISFHVIKCWYFYAFDSKRTENYYSDVLSIVGSNRIFAWKELISNGTECNEEQKHTKGQERYRGNKVVKTHFFPNLIC